MAFELSEANFKANGNSVFRNSRAWLGFLNLLDNFHKSLRYLLLDAAEVRRHVYHFLQWLSGLTRRLAAVALVEKRTLSTEVEVLRDPCSIPHSTYYSMRPDRPASIAYTGPRHGRPAIPPAKTSHAVKNSIIHQTLRQAYLTK